MSKPIGIGDRVPDFQLPDQDGRLVRFADLVGKGPVVLFFYPKDETLGCTVEACTFRDANDDFIAAGAAVVGISSDGVDSHRRFAARHRLGYTLLADEGGRVRAQFGIARQLLGMLDGRVTFIVDKEGVVRQRFESQVRVKRHVEEALAMVRDLGTATA